MTFFKRLLGSLLGGGRPGGSAGANAFYVYVRCNACGEHIRVRVHREHDLSAEYDGDSDVPTEYRVHKELVGRDCFRRIGLDITFDSERRPTEQRVTGGTIVSREEYEAAEASRVRAAAEQPE